MIATLRSVGLDVHKAATTIAVAEGSGRDAVVFGKRSSWPGDIQAVLAQLRGPSRTRCCGEAGPPGSVLVRHLRAAGRAPNVFGRSTCVL